MALVAFNSIVDGFSGKFGNDIVFKTMRGKTFACTPARKPDKKKESAAQRETRTRFQQASEWAQMILIDPDKKAYYRQRAKALRLPNAYTAALTDYMRTARLLQMRDAGDTVVYKVSKKDFALQRVTITAHDDAGSNEINAQSKLTASGCIFKLTRQQRRNGVHLEVTDAAGRITTWRIFDS